MAGLVTVVTDDGMAGIRKVASLMTMAASARLTFIPEIKVVTIHVPFDSIRFRLLPFDFDYFDSIMQNINDF